MNKPKVVDEYEISMVEEEGFVSVVLKFKTADGAVSSYAFPPLYAHKLADELTMASIRAVAK